MVCKVRCCVLRGLYSLWAEALPPAGVPQTKQAPDWEPPEIFRSPWSIPGALFRVFNQALEWGALPGALRSPKVAGVPVQVSCQKPADLRQTVIWQTCPCVVA